MEVFVQSSVTQCSVAQLQEETFCGLDILMSFSSYHHCNRFCLLVSFEDSCQVPMVGHSYTHYLHLWQFVVYTKKVYIHM